MTPTTAWTTSGHFRFDPPARFSVQIFQLITIQFPIRMELTHHVRSAAKNIHSVADRGGAVKVAPKRRRALQKIQKKLFFNSFKNFFKFPPKKIWKKFLRLYKFQTSEKFSNPEHKLRLKIAQIPLRIRQKQTSNRRSNKPCDRPERAEFAQCNERDEILAFLKEKKQRFSFFGRQKEFKAHWLLTVLLGLLYPII